MHAYACTHARLHACMLCVHACMHACIHAHTHTACMHACGGTWCSPSAQAAAVDVICFYRSPLGAAEAQVAMLGKSVTASRLTVALPANVPMSHGQRSAVLHNLIRCMHAYACMRMHACIHIHTHAMRMHACACMHACMHVCVYVYAYAYALRVFGHSEGMGIGRNKSEVTSTIDVFSVFCSFSSKCRWTPVAQKGKPPRAGFCMATG